MAEAKGLALSVAIAPGTPSKLIADPSRLRQILVNLLGNAVKFTRQGAIDVRWRISADGSALRIEIADTGPGISADQRQRLFQDFGRLDIEATSKVEGAGLGLALSARLASLMGGRLGLEDNPGGGSVFWLALPLDTVATPPPATAPGSGVPDTKTESAPNRILHALVVDDVLMNCDIASAFLRAAGHTAICVESGAEAVAAAGSTDFDVVLMDVCMPEMDGFEATRRIRALEGPRRQVPIVALTAQAFTDQIAECRKAGMDTHLSKPFNQDTLLAAILRATEARPAHEESLRPGFMPDTVPAAAVIPSIAADLPVLNVAAFERITSGLTPEAVIAYLETIAGRCASILHGVRESVRLARFEDELTMAAHTLAGSAGLFGFDRLATTGRHFECATQSSAPEAYALADEFGAAIEATLQVIQDRTPTATQV
jgi:two-component system sensor histidine kinase/response regulator